MPAKPRPYQDSNDLEAIRILLQAGRAARNGTYYIHVGDLNWWLFYPHLSGNPFEHITLWEDSAGLVGWALFDPRWNSVYVNVHPTLRGTPEAWQIYASAINRTKAAVSAKGGSAISVEFISQDDDLLIDWLHRNGFQEKEFDAQFYCSLSKVVVSPSIPQGFLIRACQGIDEVESRAAAQKAAFGTQAPLDRYLNRFRSFMNSGVYDPELDIVAESPDGQIAAFCIVWLDPVNRVGNFEPVGTHPDFQRRGLGKAVMSEALLRLQTRGMAGAIVATHEDNQPAVQLYQSMGFRQMDRLGRYTTDI